MGRKNEMGYWEADGSSALAKTELRDRLSLLMIKRERSELWAEQPPKIRQVVRLEASAEHKKSKLKFDTEEGMFKKLEAQLPDVLDAVLENVMQALSLGEKTVIWTLTRKSVDITRQAVEKEIASKNYGTKMRDVKCRVFSTSGEMSIPDRFALCSEFVNHKGAAVFVATMQSITVSISLFSAHPEHACYTEHYAQMHYLPGVLEQSESRIVLRGSSKITIFYYILKGTVSERIEQLVLPRLIALDDVVGSTDAVATASAFTPKKETFSDFLARLTENALEDGEVDLSDDDE